MEIGWEGVHLINVAQISDQ